LLNLLGGSGNALRVDDSGDTVANAGMAGGSMAIRSSVSAWAR
jgi:hypothetical protein